MKNTFKILLLIVFLISLVVCEDDFKGDVDTKRVVQCQSSGNSHQIKSEGKMKSAGTELKNELDVTIEYNDNNIRGKLEYQSESKVNGTSMSSKQKFKMVFWEIFSYVPTTTNGYNGEAKTASFFLGGSSNSVVEAFDSSNNKCTLDSKGVYTAKVVASLGTGSVTITYNFAGTTFSQGTVTVPNNALKFSVNINNFPFPSGTDTQYIAMRMVLLSKSKVSQKTAAKIEGKSNDAIVSETTTNKAWFAWLPTVTDDKGANVPVLTSTVSNVNFNSTNVDSGDISNQVYFTFAKSRPLSLNWDPQVGVQTSSATLLSFSAFLLLILALLF